MQQEAQEKGKGGQFIEISPEMSLQELYKFKNQKECEVFQKTLPNDTIVVGGGEIIRVEFWVHGQDKKLPKGCKLIHDSPELKIVQQTVDSSILISDIKGIINKFREQINELNKTEKDKSTSIDKNDN